jgi:diaminopimelate decarboxylase
MMTPKVQAFLEGLGPTSPATLVYDLDVMDANAQNLKAVGERTGVEFLFAVKSFPVHDVLRLATQHLAGFDVSNAEEATLVKKVTDARNVVSFACPGLDAERLDALLAVRSDALVSCENATQVVLARERGVKTIALRLDSTALLQTAVTRGFVPPPRGRLESRFGLSCELGQALSAAGEAFSGFHFHHGFAQSNSTGEYLAFARLAKEAAQAHGVELSSLNLGGGLWTFDFSALEHLCLSLREVLGPATRVRFEPGRLLSRGAGFGIGRVLAARSQGLREVRVLTLSRTCHVRWAHPQLLTSLPPPRGSQQGARRLLLSGPTCYEDDAFSLVPLGAPELLSTEAAAALLPVGSHAVFGGITGYSCAWNAGFNGVPPAEVRFV